MSSPIFYADRVQERDLFQELDLPREFRAYSRAAYVEQGVDVESLEHRLGVSLDDETLEKIDPILSDLERGAIALKHGSKITTGWRELTASRQRIAQERYGLEVYSIEAAVKARDDVETALSTGLGMLPGTMQVHPDDGFLAIDNTPIAVPGGRLIIVREEIHLAATGRSIYGTPAAVEKLAERHADEESWSIDSAMVQGTVSRDLRSVPGLEPDLKDVHRIHFRATPDAESPLTLSVAVTVTTPDGEEHQFHTVAAYQSQKEEVLVPASIRAGFPQGMPEGIQQAAMQKCYEAAEVLCQQKGQAGKFGLVLECAIGEQEPIRIPVEVELDFAEQDRVRTEFSPGFTEESPRELCQDVLDLMNFQLDLLYQHYFGSEADSSVPVVERDYEYIRKAA